LHDYYQKIIDNQMTLTNEAAYLYVLSKKLVKLNGKIKSYSKKVTKHKEKHAKATSKSKKEKHLKKHRKVKSTLTDLMKEHNKLLTSIKHHYAAFSHSLQKEHKL